MSEEFEVLKAQKYELEKKMSNNSSCIDCAYHVSKIAEKIIVQRERARIGAAVEELANIPPNPSISWGEGYIKAIRKVLALLKAGDPHETLPEP